MKMRWFPILLRLALVLWPLPSRAAVINVGPSDNYSKIEGAKAGDEVIIAPGQYAFRVYLTHQAPPGNPISIHAQDPANPPVWDFGTNLVDNAPGDYTAGDKARGAWQFSGAQGYNISGIVFRHCRNKAVDCSGIRYYETTTNLYIKNCLFESNDVGITGGTQDSQAVIEFCEFNANGNTKAPSSAPTHNIYIYGGYLAMRYCYLHDSVQGQNFHIRCRQSTLEYNWFARAANYEGDLMSDDDFGNAYDTPPYSQTMIFRGNVIVQNNNPGNHSQVIALYNDEEISNLTMTLNATYNSFVGTYGTSQFVHVSNADGTSMSATLSDNILSGTTVPYYIEDTTNGAVVGNNNWLPAGANPGSLQLSLQSASPGFVDPRPSVEDYHLAPGSVCLGHADWVVGGVGREYYYNELTNRLWRPRFSSYDIGAFESTSTGAPVGPYDPTPPPPLKIASVQGGHCAISWPLYAQDFQLEQSSAIAPPTWTPTTAVVVTNPNNVGVVLPASATVGFFRLTQ